MKKFSKFELPLIILCIIIQMNTIFAQFSIKKSFGKYLHEQIMNLEKMKGKNRSDSSKEAKITERMLEYYFKMFKVIDKNSEGKITKKQIELAAKEFYWPKKECKDEMYFAEFCEYMQSLWLLPNKYELLAQKDNIDKAILMLKEAYKFMDFNEKGSVTQDQVIKGLSTFFGTDVKENDVKNIFAYYKTDRLTETLFILSVINGFLDISFDRVIQVQHLESRIKVFFKF